MNSSEKPTLGQLLSGMEDIVVHLAPKRFGGGYVGIVFNNHANPFEHRTCHFQNSEEEITSVAQFVNELLNNKYAFVEAEERLENSKIAHGYDSNPTNAMYKALEMHIEQNALTSNEVNDSPKGLHIRQELGEWVGRPNATVGDIVSKAPDPPNLSLLNSDDFSSMYPGITNLQHILSTPIEAPNPYNRIINPLMFRMVDTFGEKAFFTEKHNYVRIAEDYAEYNRIDVNDVLLEFIVQMYHFLENGSGLHGNVFTPKLIRGVDMSVSDFRAIYEKLEWKELSNQESLSLHKAVQKVLMVDDATHAKLFNARMNPSLSDRLRSMLKSLKLTDK